MLAVGACSRNELPLADSELGIIESLCLTPPAANNIDYMLWGKFEVSNLEFYSNPDVELADIPVVMVDFHQAQQWCQQRGLRLPTEGEWSMVINNAEMSSSKAGARNDIDLAINRPLPGGVFERGRLEWGMYDMHSNVREWVSTDSQTHAIAVGASFASRSDVYQQLEMNKSDRAVDVGFRYVADAVEYIEQQIAPRWNNMNATQRQQARLAIGEWKKDWRLALASKLDTNIVGKDLLLAIKQ
ncbi:MAG: SUMF1/EgtB/PvdO family nonheme iron enzyme [Planctomycetes bacterium]|nr:SUMF1/EgtB/PvdO family nonheme iron enzyme [Planctomycetota bacterium]